MKKDIVRIFGSNLIKMAVTLITTFVIPMVLSVEDYGYYKLYIFYTSYVGISHLGFCDGIYLQYGEVSIDKLNKNQISREWSTLLSYETIIGLVIVGYGVIKRNLIVICLGATVVPMVVFTFYTYVYQAMGEFIRYTRIMNISTVTNLLANICLILLRVGDFRLYVICHVGIHIVSLIIGTLSFNRNNWIHFTGFSRDILVRCIKSGFLLMVGNFAYTLFIGIDKWFIKFTMDISDFSMYSFASQLLTVVNMFVTPVSMTLYSNISKRKDCAFEIKVKRTLVVFLMIFPVAIYVLTFTINHFMMQYVPAIGIVSILLITQVFLSLNLSVFINMYKAYKKQGEYFVRLVIALCVAIILDIFVYISGANTVGYALATMVSCLVWLGLNMKYFSHLIPKKNEILYVLGMGSIYLLSLKFTNEIIRCAIYIPVYVGLTRVLMRNEWRYVIKESRKELVKIGIIHSRRD